MAANFSQSAEILGLILENLAVVLNCDPAFTAGQEAKVAPLAIAIFLRYSSDPVITALSQDIFKVLAAIPAASGPLQARLVPTLLSILSAPDSGGAQSGLKSTALDVLGTLVRSAPLPLSDHLMQAAFPATVQAVLHSDDNAVLQSGGEALRAYMAAAPDQVVALVDPATGTSGLQQIVSVAGYLLNPAGSEFAATFVGRLVTTLIQKAGPGRLGDNLDLLLKAVLSKLQRAETLSVIQSLVMVYAQLIHSELDAVLNFLSGVPGPTGQSALNFVMSEWVSRQHLFYGAYESKA
jgi:importin-9